MNLPPNEDTDCILILLSGHPLNDAAVDAAREHLTLRHILLSDDWDEWKGTIGGLSGRFVFNFLSPRILHQPVLSRETVNFHPASPDYPGIGSASMALFDRVETFGATAHRMADEPDTGDILLVERFPVQPDDTCETLPQRAGESCLNLLRKMARHIREHGALPEASGERWSRKPITRKEFEEWLVLDTEDPETFERKIRCARNSKYPGPYVIVHGHKFSLSD